MGRKSNVNPNHYKTAGREPQGREVLQEMERQKFKEGQAQLFRDAANDAPAPQKKKPAAPKKPQALAKSRAKSETPRTAKAVVKNMDKNLQSSGKRGKISMAQKRTGSRHGLDTTPSTRPVAGAYGKRKAAAEILATREEYDTKKQSAGTKKSAKRR